MLVNFFKMESMQLQDLFNSNKNINAFKNSYLDHVALIFGRLREIDLNPVLESIFNCHKNQGTVIFCGNGGSHANAQHMAVGLGFVTKKWHHPLRTIALGANGILMSSLANDYGYENIFAQELKVILRPHDLVIGVSVSGNSKNILTALEFAKSRGNETYAFLGADGGEIKKAGFSNLHIPTTDLQLGVVEDVHMLLGHILGYYIEYAL